MEKFPVTVADVKRSPFTFGSAMVGFGVIFFVVFSFIGFLSGLPIIGFFVTLYGIGCLLRLIYFICKFIVGKVKQESEIEKALHQAQNPLT